MKTIGVSIPIPSPYTEQLHTVRSAVGDPLADAVLPHVTLMPPTDVAKVCLPEFCDHLAAVAGRTHSFRMTLRGTGTFRPLSPVVFVAVAEGITSCEQLEYAVRSGPIDRDLLFPYHPHVTIAHGIPEDGLNQTLTELAGYECRFEVSGFDLYEHGDDQVWRPLRTFNFGD